MNASNISDAQKAFVIAQGEEGLPPADICRQAEVSHVACYFNLDQKYAGLMRSEMRRLHHQEDANVRLKCIFADMTIIREMLQGVIKRSRRSQKITLLQCHNSATQALDYRPGQAP